MIRESLRLLLCSIFVFYTSLIFANPLNNDSVDGDYFYVGDQRIELQPSKTFKAYATTPGLDKLGRQHLEAAAYRAGETSIEQHDILDKRNVLLVGSRGSASISRFSSSLQSLSASSGVESELPVYTRGQSQLILSNEFIVQFEERVTEQEAIDLLKNIEASITEKSDTIKNRYIVSFPNLAVRAALLASNGLHQEQLVAFSEPNFIQVMPRPGVASPSSVTALDGPSPAATIPNDALFSQQWALNNTGTTGVADADIDAPEAWDIQKGSSDIIIAVLDEGVDMNHPDLIGKFITPYDATDGDNDQQPNSWDGHGTACAGIAAAHGDNGMGIAGVARTGVKIMPVRIAYSSCSGCNWVTTYAILADGYQTAVDRGAHVLSNSWGGGSVSNAFNAAIDYGVSKNRIGIFAAGNDSGSVIYPANMSLSKTIMAVSASNEWDEFKTKTSSDGETWWGSNFGPEVNIAAPGVHNPTTDNVGSAGYASGDYVMNFNGTSSATPYVAGAAALLLSHKPSLTPSEVRDVLQSTADDRGTPGYDHEFGHGRLNLEKALLALGNTPSYVEDFSSYNIGDDPADWLDTGANSGLYQQDFFEVLVPGNNSFGTTSTATNIHSHYNKPIIGLGSAYEYSGRMYLGDAGGGIGVTFMSQFPNEDKYYRLRRWSGGRTFHLSSHGARVSGDTDSGVLPQANLWYRFRIQVEDVNGRTEIRANVWYINDPEPSEWQINAYDDGDRLTEGTFGVWSMGPGGKYWDNFHVISLGSDPEQVATPGLVNKTQAEAETLIVDAGLVVGTISYENSDVVAAGQVISQDPEVGTLLDLGASVDFTVSLGPVEQVITPDVGGLTQADAEAALLAAGLTVGTVTTEYSDTVAAGIVLGQNPAWGILLPAGTPVDFWVSLGPVPSASYSESFSYPVGSDPVDWYDTTGENGMVGVDYLFKVHEVDGETAFGIPYFGRNMHSHYVGDALDGLSSYEFTGRMRISDTGTGIGVTFNSDYPNTDKYYRLRRWSGNRQFHLSPHGTSLSGDTTSGVFPVADAWYKFRIEVKDTGARIEIRARVWQENDAEPSEWQINAYDQSASRLTSGTIGVWVMGEDLRYWDDFEVKSL